LIQPGDRWICNGKLKSKISRVMQKRTLHAEHTRALQFLRGEFKSYGSLTLEARNAGAPFHFSSSPGAGYFSSPGRGARGHEPTRATCQDTAGLCSCSRLHRDSLPRLPEALRAPRVHSPDRAQRGPHSSHLSRTRQQDTSATTTRPLSSAPRSVATLGAADSRSNTHIADTRDPPNTRLAS
jgi:hypothetical protein